VEISDGETEDDDDEDPFSFKLTPAATTINGDRRPTSLEGRGAVAADLRLGTLLDGLGSSDLATSAGGSTSRSTSTNDGPGVATFSADSAATTAKAAAPASVVWQPKLEAAEFIPTLSNICPLVGICEVLESAVQEEVSTTTGAPRDAPGSAAPRGEGGDAADDRIAFAAAPAAMWTAWAVETECAGWRARAAAAADACRRQQEWAGRRRPRAREEERCTPSAATAIDEDDAVEDRHVSEAVWEQRIQARRRAIEVGKETQAYQAYMEAKKHHANDCAAPDPEDRTLSKRRWKYEVTQWRTMLRKWHVEECSSSCAASSTTGPSTEELSEDGDRKFSEDMEEEGATAVQESFISAGVEGDVSERRPCDGVSSERDLSEQAPMTRASRS
jgi:hypothetical protein